MESIPALLMLPPGGRSPSERFVAEGRLCAALDLLELLQQVQQFEPIFCAAAEPRDQAALAMRGAEPMTIGVEPFHFGHALAGLIQNLELGRLAYFGGAGAPLIAKQILERAAKELLSAEKPKAIVNSFHSTDWALMSHAHLLAEVSDRLPTDNALGWVLRNEVGFEVSDLPPSAATRMDIDTPAEIFLSAIHPQVGGELQAFANSAEASWMDRLRSIQAILNEPGSTLTIIGRSSSHVWRQLERRTQIWVRMFVEERGMTASGRLARGEVRSLIAQLLEQSGPEKFITLLAEISSGVIWDTRVWMGATGSWPSANDRFAADLGWVDQIENQRSRELAQAVQAADFPILTGGHGLVSGGIYALLESMPD